MIGLLVVTHGNLGRELVSTVALITGPQERMEGVAIGQGDDMRAAARLIEESHARVEAGDGVLIFTDLLGGTASNVSLTLLNLPGTEVISGVNLPMLLKAVGARGKAGLRECSEAAVRSGREGITAATLLLEKRSEVTP
jgi:PTS system mannose-specific IIA component